VFGIISEDPDGLATELRGPYQRIGKMQYLLRASMRLVS
jgi:hypothetical protein